MKKFIIPAILTATLSTNVFAWGEREQAALAGIVGTLLFQHVTKDRSQPQHRQPQVVYRNDNGYNGGYNGGYDDELRREYERGRLERERREYEMKRREAYNCGYTGNCGYN